MSITNFAPGVTRVPCKICGKMVDVSDESTEWNESPRNPCHRLCANRKSDTWLAPLDCDELSAIWKACQEESRGKRPPLTAQAKAEILFAVTETIRISESRSAGLAARLLYLIDHKLWKQPLRFKRVQNSPE